MEGEGGGDEEEAGRLFEEGERGEVVEGGEVTGGGMVGDAHPVVEGLEGEVDVLGGLDFDDGEAAGAVDGEDVGDAAVDAGDGDDLGVEG
jgi:hypothetical protein